MRAVAFDLDGTLLQFTEEYRTILAAAVRDVAGEAPDPVLAAYDEAFFTLLNDHEPDPVRRAFGTAVDAAPGFDADPATLADALLDREIEATRPPAGAHADLARLGERFRLGVVTNGVPEWQRAKLRAHDLADHFEAVVVSYEAGAHKPDPAPFERLEERLPADAYAMVGDDDADVDGARGAGWTAHRYEGDGFGDLPGALAW